jgi:plastocyanin
MIWRWRTFFSAAFSRECETPPLRSGLGFKIFAGLLALALRLSAGTVSGEVRLMNDSSVKRPKDASGVVVWLSTPGKAGPRAPKRRALMEQKDKKFTPHVLVIETGTTVDFPNLDPIFHNAFSNFNGQIFDLVLYPPGSSQSVRFRRPGIVRVFCNIHPSMSAIIAVVDSSYFTTTEEDGSFSIPDVPAGAYRIHFFHERATPENLERLTSWVSVSAGMSQLQPVTISETGYLPVAHKNKYGRDYSPNADGQATYTGLPK